MDQNLTLKDYYSICNNPKNLMDLHWWDFNISFKNKSNDTNLTERIFSKRQKLQLLQFALYETHNTEIIDTGVNNINRAMIISSKIKKR